jgi:hypothetical protein
MLSRIIQKQPGQKQICRLRAQKTLNGSDFRFQRGSFGGDGVYGIPLAAAREHENIVLSPLGSYRSWPHLEAEANTAWQEEISKTGSQGHKVTKLNSQG